jgi:hypothetical protein
MSTEVFLHSFENGCPQQVPTAAVLTCFEPYITQTAASFLEVAFGPADSSTVYLDLAAPTVDNLMVHRPCGDPKLAECLFHVMQLAHFILFVPGEPVPIVVAAGAIPHVPPDMLQSLGQPRVTPDLRAFVRAFMHPARRP